MFDDLAQHQLDQLTKVWRATLNATHWHESARNEMSRALAAGCTHEHLAAVTGFDLVTIDRLLSGPRRDFHGRHPTDRYAPGQDTFG